MRGAAVLLRQVLALVSAPACVARSSSRQGGDGPVGRGRHTPAGRLLAALGGSMPACSPAHPRVCFCHTVTALPAMRACWRELCARCAPPLPFWPSLPAPACRSGPASREQCPQSHHKLRREFALAAYLQRYMRGGVSGGSSTVLVGWAFDYIHTRAWGAQACSASRGGLCTCARARAGRSIAAAASGARRAAPHPLWVALHRPP